MRKRRRNQRILQIPHYPKWVFIFIGALLLYILLVVARSIGDRVTFFDHDRVNVLFYGAEPRVLSLGIGDAGNYVLYFDPSTEVYTVGGYGYYRIGSLEKLAQIEKDYDLLRRTLASALSTDIDYYFSPKETVIYDGDTSATNLDKFSLIRNILSIHERTNAHLLDRIFLAWVVLTHKQVDFVELKTSFLEKSSSGNRFQEAEFARYYKGFFYERTLREGRSELKILYNGSFKSATTLSRILEGQGIRVVDIARHDDQKQDQCLLLVDENLVPPKSFLSPTGKLPLVAAFIRDELHCAVRVTSLDDADMYLLVGKRLEELWK
ncbi:MAG: hypothetical protein UZ21_OP11001000405 [Microgenomates bacterium OLB22]|nr:MAG: hypothetical protein UZ21_OP11001000405 [Microgenomates bacterium OLB22]